MLHDDAAIVNVYSATSCGGTAETFTVTGTGSSVCHKVGNGGTSIEVTAVYVFVKFLLAICFFRFISWGRVMGSDDFHLFFSGCTVTAWSDSSCDGQSKRIKNSSCYSGVVGSVEVRC